MSRAEQRRAAVIALYQHETTGRALDETLGGSPAPFACALARAAVELEAELDAILSRNAHGWALTRINPLERAIMRIALVEMVHPEVVPGERPIPAEGAITEAVECAKTFCSAQAPAFVNGVLDAALHEVRQNDDERTGAAK